AALLLAGVAKVDRIVTATGHVKSLQPTIVVQSLERAIIASLSVRQGDRVRAGQLLATLDPTFAAADLERLKVQIESLEAEIGRLEAEHADRELVAPMSPSRYQTLQQSLWQQRHAERGERLRGLDAKIAQYQATIVKYQTNARHYAEQL